MATLIQLEDTAAESADKKDVFVFSADAREMLKLQPDRYRFVKRFPRGERRGAVAEVEAQLSNHLEEASGRGGARD